MSNACAKSIVESLEIRLLMAHSSFYLQTDLVSDNGVPGTRTDANFINGWGLAPNGNFVLALFSLSMAPGEDAKMAAMHASDANRRGPSRADEESLLAEMLQTLKRIERRVNSQKDDIAGLREEVDATGGQASTAKDTADKAATDAAAARDAVKKLADQVANKK